MDADLRQQRRRIAYAGVYPDLHQVRGADAAGEMDVKVGYQPGLFRTVLTLSKRPGQTRRRMRRAVVRQVARLKRRQDIARPDNFSLASHRHPSQQHGRGIAEKHFEHASGR